MHELLRRLSFVALAGILPCCSAVSSGSIAPVAATPALRSGVRALCPPAPPGYAQCYALVRAYQQSPPSYPSDGYGPSQLQSAYKLAAAEKGTGELVAIVDAYDDPDAETDMGLYREEYELPPCTTANGCFKKVNQEGQSSNFPSPDYGWAGEIALDLDAVSAICPKCPILLVEANSNDMDDLAAAVDQAVTLGAHVVNNSYGGVGGNGEASHYDRKGVIMVASAGDYLRRGGVYGYYGFKDVAPAAFPTVVAVGGTTLFPSTNGAGREWNEEVWIASGSGCSSLAQPTWQQAIAVGCKGRIVADVAAVADPSRGIAVFNSYVQGGGGWSVAGGTSVASAVISGVYALAGNADKLDAAKSLYEKKNRKYLNDVILGSNAPLCKIAYLCAAEPLYDAPSGWGTPSGVKAF